MNRAMRLAALAALLPAGVASAATLIHAGRLIDGVSDDASRAGHDRRRGRPDPGDRGRVPGGGRQRRNRGSRAGDGAPGLHGHARAPHRRAKPHQRARQRQEERGGPRLRLHRLRGAHAARRVHDRAQPRRPLESLDRAQARNRSRARSRARASSPPAARSAPAAATRTPATPSGRSSPAATRASTRSATAPDSCREAVRQRYQDGADSIKITATGGVLSIAKSGSAPQFTDEELAAVISTAHDYGMKVAAHAHGSRGHQARGQERHRLDRARHVHGRRGASA